MEKAFHVHRVAAKIKATERSIDEALALAAELMLEMKAGQDGLEISPVFGDPAFAKVSQAIAELAQARSSVVLTHKRLAKIYEDCGLRTVASTIISQPVNALEQATEETGELAVAS